MSRQHKVKSMDEEAGSRARSFRYEDYNNRRVFLRSYPLQWGGEEDDGEAPVNVSKERRGVKERILAVLHLVGEKTLLARKIRHKVAFYLVACHPFGFKSTTHLISA